EPARLPAETALERVAARRIEDQQLDAGAPAIDLVKDPFDAYPVAPDVALRPNLRIGRNEEALAIDLETVAAEEQERRGARPDLLLECVDGALHLLLAEVLLDVDIESAAPQLVGERAHALRRGNERRRRIGVDGVCDQQREARSGGGWIVLLLGSRRRNGR